MDGSGRSYVVGWFIGNVNFGGKPIKSNGKEDIFVSKLDSSGYCLWGVSAGGTSKDWGNSIAVDNSGNSYVTGGFSGTANFGSTTLTPKGSWDIFVAKLDKNGKF